jgi:hypothetical protein
VPDDRTHPPDQPSRPVPLDYSRPTSNRQLVNRIMLFAIWMILSGVIIFYLIRMFQTP